MASTRRKAAAVAIAIVGVAGLSLAAAAQLNLAPTTLQAGTENLADCQTGDVVVAFDAPVYDSTAGVYETDGVTLSGINVTGSGSCLNKDLSVTLITTTGPITLATDADITAASMPLAFTATDAEIITGVSAVISD